jgi:hypothetical protein
MANPSDPRAARVSEQQTYTNVTSSETALQEVQLQGSVATGPNFILHGYRLVRTGGSAGTIVSTVRFYEAGAGGNSIVYELDHSLAAVGDLGLKTGLEIPLNTENFASLNASMQNDTGTDNDYTLDVYLYPLRVV